ncbi:MAG: hypothetical protein LBP50_07825 [Tannerella sp.]|nr:hypothetical protein [Tannerella sp.]
MASGSQQLASGSR